MVFVVMVTVTKQMTKQTTIFIITNIKTNDKHNYNNKQTNMADATYLTFERHKFSSGNLADVELPESKHLFMLISLYSFVLIGEITGNFAICGGNANNVMPRSQ